MYSHREEEHEEKVKRSRWNLIMALARKQKKSNGLMLPHAKLGEPKPMMPLPLQDFIHEEIPHVEASLLKDYNSHKRDDEIRFVESTHTYFINGVQTLGSVTGLIHHFVQEFDQDAVIKKMLSGENWPRVGYLRDTVPDDVLQRLSELPFSSRLICALTQKPRDETVVCNEALQLIRTLPNTLKPGVSEIALSATEIKEKWRLNGLDASKRGTYMHLLFELYLNGADPPFYTPELEMFLRYLLTIQHLTAYRTEWMIWAGPERLAGSIDFVAQTPSGGLVLFDWKRSKNLCQQYTNRYRRMRECLGHLDDCKGIHYRLQLNLYKWVLEHYYNQNVVAMFVVATHPDNSPQRAFVDHVPELSREANDIMEYQRRKVLEATFFETTFSNLTCSPFSCNHSDSSQCDVTCSKDHDIKISQKRDPPETTGNIGLAEHKHVVFQAKAASESKECVAPDTHTPRKMQSPPLSGEASPTKANDQCESSVKRKLHVERHEKGRAQKFTHQVSSP
jgi:hypothetical protein